MTAEIQNREASIFIWMGLVLLYCVLDARTRRPLGEVIRSLLQWKILSILIGYVGGLVAITWVLTAVGMWDWNKFPTQILWMLFTGFPIVLALNKVKQQPSIYTEYVKGIFAGAAFATLVTELYSFHLVVELILIPVIALLGICLVISEQDESFRQVRGCLGVIMLLIVVSMMMNSIGWVIYKATWSDAVDQLSEFVAAAVWTFYSLFALRILSIVSAYELAFIRASFGNEDVGENAWKGKLALAWVAKGDIQLLSKFKFYWAKKIFTQRSYRDALNQAEVFRYSEIERRNAKASLQHKLRANTGVAGVDEEGYNLDQREFRETMKTLDRLWTYHTGQYHKESRYRPEVLTFLDHGFGSEDLPRPIGIVQTISDDGQSWWAYRRTVTGWYFGISGIAVDGKPRKRLVYDGQEPPSCEEWDDWEEISGLSKSLHWSLEN